MAKRGTRRSINRVVLDDAALQRLKRATRSQLRNILEEPLHDAAKAVVREAKALAPVMEPDNFDPRRQPGDLRDSIKAVTDEKKIAKRGKVEVVVGTTVFYGLFQELGWMPRGAGNRQTWGQRKQREAGQKASGLRGVGRGGAVGQPFLRPAFENNKANAREIGKSGIWRRIERLAD